MWLIPLYSVANGAKEHPQKSNSKQDLQLDGLNNALKEFLPFPVIYRVSAKFSQLACLKIQEYENSHWFLFGFSQ